jgi:PAS domain S-box-containing protein
MGTMDGGAPTEPQLRTDGPTLPVDFFVLSTDMLCVAGVDGYFKVLNPVWSRTLGYADQELLSCPYLDFVHPDDRKATLAEASKIATGFPTVRFRNRYRCKDGTYRWLAWTATPAMVDGAIYASARDITAEVIAGEEHDRRLRERGATEARVQGVLADGGPEMVFQPIVNLTTREAEGFEALARFAGPPVQPPDAWFRDADEVGLGTELELCAVANAAEAARHLPLGAFLSVNVSPATVVGDGLAAAISDLDGERVVVEVTEHAAVADLARLTQAVDRLRARGVRLAIDDAGAGHSGLNQIVQLVPEFIKLDLFLTRSIDTDQVRRAIATALVSFAREVGSTLIAEGVETAGELSTLTDLGIEHAQGYYLGRPQASPVAARRRRPRAVDAAR